MTLSEFLAKTGFTPYSTVVNSWDSWSTAGTVLMQLWTEPGQRVHNHPVPGAYMRVCCWNEQHRLVYGKNQTVGYNGRAKAIRDIEGGASGYAAMSNAKPAERGPGAWAKHADLSKVYPVLRIERPADSADAFVILGSPIPVDEVR